MDCCCYPLDVKEEIRLCREHHRYFYGKNELQSVSGVIKTVYSLKSWDGVDEGVIENARKRGELVDGYMAEYIRTGTVTLPAGERADVVERMEIAHRLWESRYGDRPALAQLIACNFKIGIAGSVDFFLSDSIEVVDLKCTYSPETSWLLQLGAYAEMMNADKATIIHISPKLYKKSGGGKIITLDANYCRSLWRSAVIWWLQMKEAELGFKEKTSTKRTAPKHDQVQVQDSRILLPLPEVISSAPAGGS